MKEKTVEYYFPIVKIIYISSLAICFIAFNKDIIYERSAVEIGLVLIFTSVTIFYELLDRKRVSLLILSLIIGIVLGIYFQGLYSALVPIAILDLIAYFRLPLYTYVITFLIVLQRDEYSLIRLMGCIYCSTLYFQHHFVLEKYKSILNSFINTEESLKVSIENQRLRHKIDIERFKLSFENKLLEEKSRLSQALHDKIGHSINGSIYQLEACKLLVDKKPEDSRTILQAVIDGLRKSMDEIRAILRKEKPDKGELALLQLRKLCEDFTESYYINAKLVCNGEVSEVPEYIWEVILDNSIEAFSNALKYSGCKNINIEISILNKIVRCIIKDDGKGCKNVKEGMGISGMKERTRAVGGNLQVEAAFGFGINMLLPISEDTVLYKRRLG
jgi:signal transduction histidine kinase